MIWPAWEAEVPLAEVRSGLALAHVLAAEAGVGVDAGGWARCPLHPGDDTPSLGVYRGADGDERFKCFGCGAGGDVFDLLQRLAPGRTFGEAADRARELLRTAPEAAWRPERHVEAGRGCLLGSARVAWQVAWQLGLAPLRRLAAAKGLPVTAEELHAEWFVGAWGSDRVVVPHLGFPPERGCAAYKTRAADGSDKPRSVAGGSLAVPYGAWRDRGRPLLLVAEGESDTWALDRAAREAGLACDVWGLPAGAGSWREEWRPRLAGRRVVTCLDGDPAGRAAAARWREDRGARSLEMPDGADCLSLGADLADWLGTGLADLLDPRNLPWETE